MPKLTRLYSDVNANLPSFTLTYLVLGLIALAGGASLFVGFKLFSKEKEIQKKYFKFGLIPATGYLFLLATYSGVATWSVTLPFLNLIPQF